MKARPHLSKLYVDLSLFRGFIGVFFFIGFATASADGEASKTGEDYLGREAAVREVKRGLEDSRSGTEEEVSSQRKKLRKWTDESRRAYSEYYKIAAKKGPNSEEALAAKKLAESKDQEFWRAKGEELQKDWKAQDQIIRRRSERTARSLEELRAGGLSSFAGEASAETHELRQVPVEDPPPESAPETPSAVVEIPPGPRVLIFPGPSPRPKFKPRPLSKP